MKESNIYRIIHFFTKQPTSQSARYTFWHWLLMSENDNSEKEEALKTYWDNTETAIESSTLTSLEAVKRKAEIGNPAQIKHLSWKHRLMRIAAVFIIPLITIAASLTYVRQAIHNSEILTYTATPNQHGAFILPDGTKVFINAESFLLYPRKFQGKTRNVYLSGEANFEVHKDKEHPFIVKTAQLEVKALGTKFNVRAYPENGKTVATLENGIIQVSDIIQPNQTFILKPNQQLAYDHYTHSFEKKQIEAGIYAAWTDGKLNLVNQTLEDIVKELQRQYCIKFIVDPQLFTNDLYTLKFHKNESLQRIMHVLKLTIGDVDIKMRDKDVIMKSSSSEKKGGAKKVG